MAIDLSISPVVMCVINIFKQMIGAKVALY